MAAIIGAPHRRADRAIAADHQFLHRDRERYRQRDVERGSGQCDERREQDEGWQAEIAEDRRQQHEGGEPRRPGTDQQLAAQPGDLDDIGEQGPRLALSHQRRFVGGIGIGRGAVGEPGEAAHGARVVNVADRDPLGVVMIAQQRHQHRRAQRIAAQILEEIGLDRHAAGAFEDVGHTAGQHSLEVGPRRDHRAGVGLGRELHHRQRGTVDLAADRGRYLGDRRDVARHHVTGQGGGELRLELFGARRVRRVLGDDIGDQFLRAAMVLHPASGRADPGERRQPCLDLGQFDAIAAQLDLRVDPPVVEEIALRLAMDEVAGAVDPAEFGVLDELLGGEVWAMAIAPRDAGAADAQFAALAIGHRLHRLVERPGGHTRDRLADGDRQPRRDVAAQAGHRAFGRTVAVDHSAPLRPQVGDVARQRLATDVEQLEIGQGARRIAAAAAAKECGRRTEDRRAFVAQPADDIGSEPGRSVVHHHQGRARGECEPGFLQRGIIGR